VYPVATSLTVDRFHSTRCLNGAPFFCILAALGLKTALSLSRKRQIKFKWQIPLIVIFAVEVGFYMKNYFGDYAVLSRSAFNASLVETIEFAFKERGDTETIYVSNSFFYHPVTKDFKPIWYSHFLFFGKIDPKTYQKYGIPPEIISPYDPASPPSSGFLLRMNPRIAHDENFTPYLEWNNEKIPEGANLLLKIPLLKDSNRFFEIYKISKTPP
jgi:hypothetical protein